jgi:hypothetical protein
LEEFWRSFQGVFEEFSGINGGVFEEFWQNNAQNPLKLGRIVEKLPE